jgi:4-amino-4-deoxy-L-arabinose transferase-like glycosyltransferase
MDRAGRNQGDQPVPAVAGTLAAAGRGSAADDSGHSAGGGTAPGDDGGTGSGAGSGTGSGAATAAATSPGGGRLRVLAARPVSGHLALLACYLAAGIALTWPRATYLVRGQLPESRDVASYVWDLWWVPHQLVHLGNPWFTGHMAAPVGVQLGFDTTMPLAGLIMSPVTLVFGPSASFSLLTILMPGLLSYVMYRTARLWLRSQPGAIAAGAFFGLSSMLAEQDWAHLNIVAGTLFLPMTVEAAVRLRRRPGRRQAVILGLVLGACLLVNQESAVMAVILAALLLIPWLARHPGRGRLVPLAIGAVVALVVASPQLIAMAQQAMSGGTGVDPHLLAVTSKKYGVGLGDLFAPAQRVGYYGLHQLAAASASSPLKGPTAEAMPMFGLLLTVLAVLGLAVSWRRRSAWQLAALWLGSAWLALGASLYIVKVQHVPFQQTWNGVLVSPVMPYTWLMRLPVLSAFREADRFAILGLVGAALLAGAAVDWLRHHARPLIVVVAALGVLEAGYSAGPPSSGIMPTALPALDRPIAADHSGSIVLDVPFGLRGGIPQYGKRMAPPALVIATADGHPRSISYTSWVPSTTANGILAHPFYAQLMRAQSSIPLAPRRNAAGNQVTSAELAAARADLRGLGIGWALVWTRHPNPQVDSYLRAVGFRYGYRVDGAIVFQFAGR